MNYLSFFVGQEFRQGRVEMACVYSTTCLGLGWEVGSLRAGDQLIHVCGGSRLAGALGWNTTGVCLLDVAWALSQYGDWMPRVSLLREPGRNCVKLIGPSLEVAYCLLC